MPEEGGGMAADAALPVYGKMSKEKLRKCIEHTTALMREAAKNLDFIQAAQYRDELLMLSSYMEEE